MVAARFARWTLALCCCAAAGCSSSSHGFDPTDTGGNTTVQGSGTNGSGSATTTTTGSSGTVGTTSASTGSTGTQSGSTGSTATDAPGSGDFAAPAGNPVVQAARVLSSTPTDLVAGLIELQLTPAQLCDGHVLSDLSADPIAVFVGIQGQSVGVGEYALGPDHGVGAFVAFATAEGGAQAPYAPLKVGYLSDQGDLIVSFWDGHHLTASFSGTMIGVNGVDGGGEQPFSGDVDAYDCH